jgi:hypothetical protein
MIGSTKVALAIGAGLGAIALAALASKSSATPAKPGGGTIPPAANAGWIPAATINPGDDVRITLPASSFNVIASAIPGLGTGITGWTKLLSQLGSNLTGVATPSIVAWAPGDALPADWPNDDINRAAEYHAEFTYGGPGPVLVTALPIPVQVWVKKGLGQVGGGIGGTNQPKVWRALGTRSRNQPRGIFQGNRFRVSITPLQLRTMAFSRGLSNDAAGMAALVASWPARAVNVTTYAPGQTLPADWPSDLQSATEWHADATATADESMNQFLSDGISVVWVLQ